MNVAVLAPAAPASAVRVTLSDGRAVGLRPLDATDAEALSAAIARADPMDLRRRFMGVPPPTSVILRRLRAADGVHDFALGAFDETTGRLVGVAQFDRADDRPSAEFAIEVAADWQRVGLGTEMLKRLMDIAVALGITKLTAIYYADNMAVRRLLRRSGRVSASGFEQGEGYAVLDIARSDQRRPA
jgi:acetyltransferase